MNAPIDREPTRAEVDQMVGLVLLEFGASWCGHCQAVAPRRDALLDEHPEIQHIPIEDGPGRPLGRSFRVKLWPTFVFLRDGEVVRQVSRPDPDELREGFETLVNTAR
ncbi:thioredoxin family protein [Tautonia rosea]|uniref:thioredoxin family protein n=1 Tax=Tautonia rosea TaxID=2728037 RepID=UPI001473F07D|nr:thioredoxin family protein [Tautonia rosea]